jgi:hypothetical protein
MAWPSPKSCEAILSELGLPTEAIAVEKRKVVA